MEIENDTIIFKSAHTHWVKEKSGSKPNTVRYIPLPEVHQYMIQLDEINGKMFVTPQEIEVKKIRIINTATGDVFERELTDVTFAEVNMMPAFIFSWQPVKKPE